MIILKQEANKKWSANNETEWWTGQSTGRKEGVLENGKNTKNGNEDRYTWQDCQLIRFVELNREYTMINTLSLEDRISAHKKIKTDMGQPPF